MADSRTPPQDGHKPHQAVPLLQEEKKTEKGPETTKPKSALKSPLQSPVSSPILGAADHADSPVLSPRRPPNPQRNNSWTGHPHGHAEESNFQEDMGRFLEDAQKSSDKVNLAAGFYSEQDQAAPRHHIDEADYESHRGEDFPHVRPPLSLKTRPSSKKDHGDKGHKGHKSKSKKKQEVPVYIPALSDVQEGSSQMSSGDSVPTTPRDYPDVPRTTAPLARLPSQSSTDSQPEKPEGKIDPSGRDRVDFYIGEGSPGKMGGVHYPIPAHVSHSRTLVEDLMSDEEPHPSPVVSTGSFPVEESIPGPKVKFTLGSSAGLSPRADSASYSDDADDEEKPEEKPRRHYHRHHSVPSEKELARRRHPGSEVHLSDSLRRVPTEKDEAAMLAGADLDDMASHRFGDTRGLRRRKISPHSAVASVVHIGKADKKKKKRTPVKFDHSPHELFVELDELFVGENEEFEWQEKARWIKFEEDVEEGADRWGKPHVASLSFHSLLELRRCIEHGAIMLDLQEEDLTSVVNAVVEQLVTTDQLHPLNKGKVIKALLLKHRHVHQGGFIRRNLSYLNLLGLDHTRPSPTSGRKEGTGIASAVLTSSVRSFFSKQSMSSPATFNGEGSKPPEPIDSQHVKVEIESSGDKIHQEPAVGFSHRGSSPDLQKHYINKHYEHMMKKIPKGSEATTVLVGAVDFLDQPVMAFVRLSEGRFLGNLTEVPLPVRFLIVLLGPVMENMDYHEIGRSISTLMSNTRFHDVAYHADGRNDLLSAINEFLDDSMVLPPGDWDKKSLMPIMDMQRKKAMLKQKTQQMSETEVLLKKEADAFGDPLKRTGRPFGGMRNDMRRRYPKYLSDIRDGLNVQCLATFFFIYFAALSPAITFGGLLGEKTDKWMGVSEMLVVTCGCGIVFSLLSGQPLVIIGATGPILVFEEGLYQFCSSFSLEYLSMRAWVGYWVTLIAILVVAVEGSFFVRYFTRFTEEIFASLISLIFIYEVFKKLYVIFTKHPLMGYYPSVMEEAFNNSDFLEGNNTGAGVISSNDTNDSDIQQGLPVPQPNTALLSVILCLGTYFIASSLKQFRNSKMLGRTARRAIGDFGIPIAIAIMVLVDFLLKETYTEKLDVPDGFSPTAPYKRGWIISPLGLEEKLPIWAMFAAVIPALLVFILVFMESQITSMIVNKADRKLKKGSGYHLDLFWIGTFASISGTFGLPFLCAASVRSITHVSALSVMSKSYAPGEKPKLEFVREQRLTSFAVHIMIGVSVLMGPVLRQVPLAVLFGVFLYMGVASMSGIQLFERLELVFMPVKHHPDVGYVRRVRMLKMHLYTFIQLVCLAALWAVKSTQAALGFPFVLVLMVPVRRHLLPLIFTKQELHELDKAQEDQQEEDPDEEDEPDFYAQVPF